MDRLPRCLDGRIAVCACLAIALWGSASPSRADPPAEVRFDRDIEPILAVKCYHCHGPDKQKAELRLDGKDAILKGGESGVIIKAGQAAESLMYQRVAGLNDLERMPPGRKDWLTDEQVRLLRTWIEQGARFPERPLDPAADPRRRHWAYQTPMRPQPPEVRDAGWARSPLDRFILARLEKEGLKPSPEADRHTLIRRVSLDLTGLPPTLEEVEAFVKDESPEAYEQLVDRLLASPQYGEHQARQWLDAARYADSNGYEKDRARVMWRYRDWVINAFNADLPYDRFTIEQLAGDMLPGATLDQRIATGFHRNTMINEEGGIDVEEFRYYAVVDRVATTGTVFLGMTLGCAQCHNHKFDPISQREYFQVFALFNNADEPILETPTEAEIAREAQVEKEIAEIEARLPEEFPLPYEELRWTVLEPAEFTAASGGKLVKQEDGSLLARWAAPERDTFTVTTETNTGPIVAVRLEALTDSSLPRMGPGLSDSGNFVLSEFTVTAAGRKAPAAARPVGLKNPSADFSQEGFAVASAIDGDPATGWAVADSKGGPSQSRTATFELKEPIAADGGTRLVFTLAQNFGGRHLLGRFRLWAGSLPRGTPADVDELRRGHLAARQAAWEAKMMRSAARWTILAPQTYSSQKGCTFTLLEDQSLLVTGDRPSRDVYTVEYDTDLDQVSSIRLEVLADRRLPARGPGRGGVEEGNFQLSELEITAWPRDGRQEPVPVKLAAASADYVPGNSGPDKCFDGRLDSGWGVGGATGQDHQAVFRFEKPVGFAGGTRLRLTLIQNYFDQMTLGRFRVSATADPRPLTATAMPADLQDIFTLPLEWRNARQRERVRSYFLTAAAPELADRHRVIAAKRKSIASPTTSLVMEERAHKRPTHLHPRGEFLARGEPLEPGVPAVLPPLPADQPADRLTFARWLFDERHPLTARVAVNRAWQQYFGRGLVAEPEDFGLRCEPPSHPDLLDWLAVEFRERQRWSLKALHRMLVTSATYRQSSHVSRPLLERDPYNVLLARGPRFRLEAEVIRDAALRSAGLLHLKIGGPSVYPPLPEGVASLSYGGFTWPASTGDDKYRRGLYTFLKRTNPYPSFVTFDQPMRSQCSVRRIRSNTPLQSLVLLNDEVYTEAVQALARRILEKGPPDPRQRVAFAFQLCLSRPPDDFETDRLLTLFNQQREQFKTRGSDAAKVALPDPARPPTGMDVSELAAWTIVAGTLLNLDETVTRG